MKVFFRPDHQAKNIFLPDKLRKYSPKIEKRKKMAKSVSSYYKTKKGALTTIAIREGRVKP